MTPSCGICLGVNPSVSEYHPKCLKELFGAPTLPVIDLDEDRLLELALAMIGHTSISGVQKKISLSLEKATLRYTNERSQYILKPPINTFPELPENEHLTMQLARLFRLKTPSCGLLRLKDGRVAYIVRRFDRTVSGKKLHQEDFCQLSELPPKDKYTGTGERCVKLIKKYASEPLLDISVLYRMFVFSWWSGSGDMHLKNFSLLKGDDDRYEMSPAYDLVNTDMYPRMDQGLAQTIDGRRTNLTRPVWLRFAKACGLPDKVAIAILDEVGRATRHAEELIAASWLSSRSKDRYLALLSSRSKSML